MAKQKQIQVQPKVDVWQWAFVLAIHLMDMDDLHWMNTIGRFPEAPDDITPEQAEWCRNNMRFVISKREASDG